MGSRGKHKELEVPGEQRMRNKKRERKYLEKKGNAIVKVGRKSGFILKEMPLLERKAHYRASVLS